MSMESGSDPMPWSSARRPSETMRTIALNWSASVHVSGETARKAGLGSASAAASAIASAAQPNCTP